MEPGTVLLDKYRIERVLGAGGMGLVVRAHHLQLDRPVAIKILLPAIAGQREIVQRFLREAQAASRLTSEHVARVLDVGTLPDGAPYMVLEYLEGADLSRVTAGALAPGEIVELILQACEALAEAHALGIVHRDIKPANLFVTRRADGDALLKVLDFGISKTSAPGEGQLTSTHSVMGTPAYMSPEQMRSSRDVDARADIWSLGAVLYELCQGAPPFVADSFTGLCLAVTMDAPAPLTAPIPPRLREVVHRCLEKAPAARFQTIAELAAALAPFATVPARAALSVERVARTLAGAAPSFRATVGARAVPTTLRGAAGARGTNAPHHAGRRRLAIASAAAAVVVACGVIAMLVVGGRHGGDARPAARAEPAAVPAPTAELRVPVPAPATPAATVPVAAPTTPAPEPAPTTDVPIAAPAPAVPAPRRAARRPRAAAATPPASPAPAPPAVPAPPAAASAPRSPSSPSVGDGTVNPFDRQR